MAVIHYMLLWFLHPIHVSVTEINYNEKNKSFEIISRVFIDDLELSIQKKMNQESLDIIEPKNGQTTDQLVSAYLAEHLKVKLDGKPVKMKYIAHEIEDLAIICYLEIEGVKKIKSLEVTNTVIQETHADQSNLVHITYKAPVKSFRLMRDKPTEVLQFSK